MQAREPQPAPDAPGELRLHGFVSKPEIQKLNRNSIFIFVNGRLIRDRLILHALTDAYRNIIPPTVFPVVLLFLEMPFSEVDVNVHPSKTEVRFRQSSFLHDFVRDSVRAALMKARPVPAFATEIHASPTARAELSPRLDTQGVPDELGISAEDIGALTAPGAPARTEPLEFGGSFAVEGNAAVGAARLRPQGFGSHIAAPRLPAQEVVPETDSGCGALVEESDESMDLSALSSLRPLGQIRDSFILAVEPQGLWIVDQHVAHERVLFEKILRQRAERTVESQRLLMPIIVELTPAQLAIFAELCGELERNGFEAEAFGSRTIAVKTAPAGIEAAQVERMLAELLEQFERERQALNLEQVRRRIAASIACHAAIKVNMPLEQKKMEWLLAELAKTECPMSCPHGRPVVLRYSVKDIQKAFKRI